MITCTILYLSVSWVGPGFVEPEDAPESTRTLGDTTTTTIDDDSSPQREATLREEEARLLVSDDLQLSDSQRQSLPNRERRLSPPPLRYCDDCEQYQPMRTKHCRDCERCVRRFDHHCFWVGACVGEKNHRHFYWFLLFQTIGCYWTLAILIESFAEDTGWAWMERNTFVLIACVDCGGMGLLPLGLLFYHTYLIITARTTWEDLKAEKITYMDGFRHISPFDRGFFRNIWSFCCQSANKIEWSYEPMQVALARRVITRQDVTVADNCWNNKYYSCC